MNTKAFKEIYNITDKEIAKLFNIPIRTIENWNYRNTMPEYVWNMMNSMLNAETHIRYEQLLEKPEKKENTIRFLIDNNCSFFMF